MDKAIDVAWKTRLAGVAREFHMIVLSLSFSNLIIRPHNIASSI